MITMDANTGEVERMRNDLLEVHTVFLDKKCSRGWIPATAIEVISTADMIENGPGEKLQMKVIKGGQKKKRKVMSTSNAALAEATRVLAMNVAERTAFNPFPYREPEPEPSPPPRKVIKGKREPTQKAPKVERPVKRRKTEEEIAEEKREKAAERAKLLRERREMESEARRQRKELEQKENAENLAQKEAQMEPIPTVDPTVCYACHKAGDLVACQAPNCNKYHVEASDHVHE
ncbi:hypothetical protein SARC_06291 [Sphaeroforma arctica JP610]|uniref:Uncharacterized protein n=1 Tax=Sphaeroforma arctica JP610 TaxID=667725 RepID=A0A0L0FXU8_9EUKA|nr:hypothetical protein SARC_06291 [Sphaeroforma arctica JP610]KNC81386.1 hypothetical protein SARC_06291 [Sphaeroforma arctica JP610]|eukprot:XP_014155288.1 hypothetical protein SARC_06291 [Sphaeroforma arctica JP610]